MKVISFLALLSGCATTTMDAHTPGAPVPVDRVVLVGLAEFEPALAPGKPASVDPKGRLSHILLGFTYDPNKKVDVMAMSHGLDEYFQVLPGQPFAVRAPRRPMFLRVVNMYLGYHFTGRVAMVPHPEAEKELEWITCPTQARVAPVPQDQIVYVGTIRCAHQNGRPTRVTIHDELDRIRPSLPALVGTATVTPRLAEPVAGP